MSAQARHQHPELGLLGWEVAETDVVFSFLTDDQARTRVYPEWSAADVLRHLVWWHESFAAIVAGCADGGRPSTPGGSLAQVNARGVEELAAVSPRRLRGRLRAAQRLIEDRAPDLPYRRGGRRYTVGQRIGIAAGEMRQHRRDVVRALLGATAQRTRPVSPGDASGTADRAGGH
ncbi:MAG: maleylpyruvate isomerase N-terminal domain-containing protein [Propionibacteriaceae bacterium]|nr:maleylpyruvate isomerase N-terminal domain-containing protein [Propionibacteriaceae bacterium]